LQVEKIDSERAEELYNLEMNDFVSYQVSLANQHSLKQPTDKRASCPGANVKKLFST